MKSMFWVSILSASLLGGVGCKKSAEEKAEAKYEKAQENVKDLVDKYVCHPSAQDWWKPILVREAARLGGGP